MSKPEQIIVIEPQNELKFIGPFNVPVTTFIKLTNPTDKSVVFKIKTTAPKKYCVRPNSGLLEPKNVTEIAICLQPFIFDPAEKNKHKFMVQTAIAPDEEFHIDDVWKEINAENLMDSKLKCVFEMPAKNGATAPPDRNAELEEKAIRILEHNVSKAPMTPQEAELLKAAQEVKTLREEESTLRQENLQLKEEVLRLKHSIAQSGGASTGPSSAPRTKYTPPPVDDQFLPLPALYLVVGVVIALLGVMLGKFVL